MTDCIAHSHYPSITESRVMPLLGSQGPRRMHTLPLPGGPSGLSSGGKEMLENHALAQNLYRSLLLMAARPEIVI